MRTTVSDFLPSLLISLYPLYTTKSHPNLPSPSPFFFRNIFSLYHGHFNLDFDFVKTHRPKDPLVSHLLDLSLSLPPRSPLRIPEERAPSMRRRVG